MWFDQSPEFFKYPEYTKNDDKGPYKCHQYEEASHIENRIESLESDLLNLGSQHSFNLVSVDKVHIIVIWLRVPDSFSRQLWLDDLHVKNTRYGVHEDHGVGWHVHVDHG